MDRRKEDTELASIKEELKEIEGKVRSLELKIATYDTAGWVAKMFIGGIASLVVIVSAFLKILHGGDN